MAVESGDKLPGRAEIACDETRFRTQTDSAGKFSFIVQTVGEGANDTPSNLEAQHTAERCSTVVVSLPGYRSRRMALIRSSSPDWMPPPIDLGVIVLRRLKEEDVPVVTTSDLSIPKKARQAYDRGIEGLRAVDPRKAAVELRQATRQFPEYLAAWMALAATLTQTKDWPEATLAADRAIGLGGAKNPEAQHYRALALCGRGKLPAALESARDAVRLDADNRLSKTACLLGSLESSAGNTPAAVEAFRMCLQRARDPRDSAMARGQLAKPGVQP